MAKQRAKQISWKIYGAAGLTTVVAFLLGALLAYAGMSFRISIVQDNLADIFVTMLSYQEVSDIVSPCENPEYIWVLGTELDRVGKRLSAGDYPPYLLKYYALLEASHVRMIKRMQQECNADVHWVLFFQDAGCTECDVQARILTRLKSENPQSVYIYTFKYSLDSPIVSAYRVEYNITKLPTVVVDGNKFEGLIDIETLRAAITSQ